MKRFTLVFSLLMAMFTAAMAQESIDFSNGTLSGQHNADKFNYSQWTNNYGLQIVSTDPSGNEVPAMKYYNNRFQLDINSDVATPIKFTITAPEGYSLTEMKLKNSARSHNAHIDYDWSSYSLYDTTAEMTIEFVEGVNEFFLYGQGGRAIYLTSLTVTKTGEETSISEVKGENGEVKAIYDLTGRRINEIARPGIYIVGGKKVFVK